MCGRSRPLLGTGMMICMSYLEGSWYYVAWQDRVSVESVQEFTLTKKVSIMKNYANLAILLTY